MAQAAQLVLLDPFLLEVHRDLIGQMVQGVHLVRKVH